MADAIGWISSLILTIAVGKQVYKQWREKTSEGVSPWLFIGQITASFGFLLYSYLIWAPVFLFTNTLMLLNGLFGLIMVFKYRHSQPAAKG